MNANQLLSLRVNTRLLRENVDVLRFLDRLIEDCVINSVSMVKVTKTFCATTLSTSYGTFLDLSTLATSNDSGSFGMHGIRSILLSFNAELNSTYIQPKKVCTFNDQDRSST